MTWLKVDDGLAFHPKVVQAGNRAMGLWVRAGAWCSGHLTDGHLPVGLVSRLDGRAADARALVAAGLWVPVGAGMHAAHRLRAAGTPALNTPAQTAPSTDGDETATERSTRGLRTYSVEWPWRGQGAGAETDPGCALCAEPSGFRFTDWTDWQPSRAQVLRDREAATARQAQWRARQRHAVTDENTGGTRHGVTSPAPTRPDPTRSSMETSGGVFPTATRADAEPPRRCPRHTTAATPGPCRACGDARRDHDAWERARGEAPRVTGGPCHLHPAHPARGCPACAAEATPPPADLRAQLRKRA